MRTIGADIVVIGAGPTGAAVTWRLAAAGCDVLCLERGHWADYAALRRGQPDWEARRAGPLHANPNIRRGPDDQPIDDRASPIKPMLASAVGGSSLHWAAHAPRYRPEDFRVQALDGVAADWPIAYPDLEPYYEINEARLGLAFLPGDPSAPPRELAPRALPTLGPHGRRIAAAFDRLGWHWWPVDLVVGADGDEAATVHCDHIGPCDLGCPSRIRSGADRAYMAPALAAGAKLMTGMRAHRLEHDARGRIAAVHCHGDDGPVRVAGRVFVVCGNGLGTPWLLLNSASDTNPDGLANSSGLVGRNLMLHPHARVDGIFDQPLGTWSPGETAGLISLEFMASAGRWPFSRGFKLQLSPGPGPLALARGAATQGGPLPWGAAHRAAFERLFDHVAGLTICIEDLPDADNRIALSKDVDDRDGEPAPAMHYALSADSRACLDFGLQRGEEVLREAGATEFFRESLRAQAGFHLMGTARMGRDPAGSVVDPWGRAHDHPNLFIADASAFVTAGCLNPTSTAQAFALRLADHLVETEGRS